jgi:hypothetical protein
LARVANSISLAVIAFVRSCHSLDENEDEVWFRVGRRDRPSRFVGFLLLLLRNPFGAYFVAIPHGIKKHSLLTILALRKISVSSEI